MKKHLILIPALMLCACNASAPKTDVPSETDLPEETAEAAETETPVAEDTDRKTVGDDEYGYLQIPGNWGVFEDVNGASAKQWSDTTSTYIVSLDYFPANGYDAETYAANYMDKVSEEEPVEDVHAAKVTAGKYDAYQVYMFYPDDAVFLVTYWFETEDGMIRYIGIEGGADLSDYLFIPESFSLTADGE